MYGFVKNAGMAMAIWQQAVPKMVYVKIIGVRSNKIKIEKFNFLNVYETHADDKSVGVHRVKKLFTKDLNQRIIK